jgi:hypothetical protein
VPKAGLSSAVPDREATPAPSLQINAANPGTWGDRISVSIEDGSLNPANAFNLIVKYKDNIVEVFIAVKVLLSVMSV